MLEFFKFACSSFWTFIGCMILLTVILSYVFPLIKYIFDFLIVCIRGRQKDTVEEITDECTKTTIKEK